MVKLVEGDYMRQLCIEVSGVPSYCMNIEECVNIKVEVDGKPWYYDIKDSEYQSRAIDSERKFIKCMACQFFLSGEVLYKRNHDTTLFWCINAPKASHLMEEMHEGLHGAHANGPLLVEKSWEPATISSPWKVIALSMSWRATVAKFIRIGRIFLPNLYTQ